MTEVELIDPLDHLADEREATWFGSQFIKERYPEGQSCVCRGR